MIGWSLSQAGAPEMGISEEGAASCCTELPTQITPSYVCCSQPDDCADTDDGHDAWRSASAVSMVSKRRIESEEYGSKVSYLGVYEELMISRRDSTTL